jgi:hypothetical protein
LPLRPPLAIPRLRARHRALEARSRAERSTLRADACGMAALSWPANSPVELEDRTMRFQTTQGSLDQGECFLTADLFYCITARSESDARCFVTTTMLVKSGVKYTAQYWPKRPTKNELVTECKACGYFSHRPYRLSQEADDSTLVCVLALYGAYCDAAGLDPTESLRRAYPSVHAKSWQADTWQLIRDVAKWQGIEFPISWYPEQAAALLAALRSQGYAALAAVLAAPAGRDGNPGSSGK